LTALSTLSLHDALPILALTLTPALCATLLKPVHGHEEKRGFFAWFDRKFDAMANGYQSWVTKLLKRTGRMMAGFAVVIVLLGVRSEEHTSELQSRENLV